MAAAAASLVAAQPLMIRSRTSAAAASLVAAQPLMIRARTSAAAAASLVAAQPLMIRSRTSAAAAASLVAAQPLMIRARTSAAAAASLVAAQPLMIRARTSAAAPLPHPLVPRPYRPTAGAALVARRFPGSPPSLSVRCFSALSPEMKSTLDKVVGSHKVILFMKGNKDFPQCGFSNTVVQILKSVNVPFETVDILENEMLRQGLKEYSSWPTFPQLYIDGEFFGGCDVTLEAYQSGQLQEILEKAMCS